VQFVILGTHTYANPGPYSAKVKVKDDGLASTDATAAITSTPPPGHRRGRRSAAITEGNSAGGCCDVQRPGDPGSYSASIDWGDGNTETATPSNDGSGHFAVSGTHTYTDEDTRTIRVPSATPTAA